MGRKGCRGMSRSTLLALAALAIGLLLVVARSGLNDGRSELREAYRVRDARWDNYLLAERRTVDADLLLVMWRDARAQDARDVIIGAAVGRTRGAFQAISAAADRDIPQEIRGMNDAQIAVQLLDATTAETRQTEIQLHFDQLHDEAVQGIDAFRETFSGIESYIWWLVLVETALFLAALFVTFLSAVHAARVQR